MRNRILLTVLLVVAVAGLAAAFDLDDRVRRVTVTCVFGTGSVVIAESDTGLDRIANVDGGLFTFDTSSASTCTLQLISGNVTNEPDVVAGLGTNYVPYAPTAEWYVQVGDTLGLLCTDTARTVTAWFWLK